MHTAGARFIGGALAASAIFSTAVAAPPAVKSPLPEDVALAPRNVNTPIVEHPENVLVRFRADADPKQVAQSHISANAIEIVTEYTIVPNLFLVRVPAGGVHAAINAYVKSGVVQYAEPDYIRYATVLQPHPYGIDLVDAPSAWPFTTGAGIKVADLDTGVDIGHPDLPVAAATASFISGQTVQDGHGHGTHTAGTILARDNDFGVVGVAPQAVLLAGKVLSNGGTGSDSGIISGIQWAVGQGAKVINMSLGGAAFNQAFSDACQNTFNNGVVICAASGNDGVGTPHYPAAYPGVISVAAINSAGVRASFSNFGSTVDLSAPGVGVYSTFRRTASSTTTDYALWSNVSHTMILVTGTASTVVTAPVIYCSTGGLASDFPATVSGKIAHIRRGGTVGGVNITFNTKCANAQAAGAIGVIISDDGRGLAQWTTNGPTYAFPAIGVSQADGDNLVANPGISATIGRSVVTTYSGGYATEDGTSMASPHAAGVAALLWGAFPSGTLTPALIEQAMEQSALDVGAPGRDDYYGWGIVSAERARQWLAARVIVCPADIATAGSGDSGPDGEVTGEDFDLYIQAFFTLQRNAENLLIADIATAGTGAIGRDGQVTGEDFDAFVQQFYLGCP